MTERKRPIRKTFERRSRERVMSLTKLQARYVDALADRGIFGTTRYEVLKYLLHKAISDLMGSAFLSKFDEQTKLLRERRER